MIFDLRYTVGYKTALRHVIQWFVSHDYFLRTNKLRKYKGCQLVLKKMHENADRFMEAGDAFEFPITEDEVKKAGGISKKESERDGRLIQLKREERFKSEHPYLLKYLLEKQGIRAND